jgi:Tfp pilus assembly protein FimV
MHTGSLSLRLGASENKEKPLSERGNISTARVLDDQRAAKHEPCRPVVVRYWLDWRAAVVLILVFAAVLSPTKAKAAWLGHSRIVSAVGAPLRVEVPIMGLSDHDAQALRVHLADESSWHNARLTPPCPVG